MADAGKLRVNTCLRDPTNIILGHRTQKLKKKYNTETFYYNIMVYTSDWKTQIWKSCFSWFSLQCLAFPCTHWQGLPTVVPGRLSTLEQPPTAVNHCPSGQQLPKPWARCCLARSLRRIRSCWCNFWCWPVLALPLPTAEYQKNICQWTGDFRAIWRWFVAFSLFFVWFQAFYCGKSWPSAWPGVPGETDNLF